MTEDLQWKRVAGGLSGSERTCVLVAFPRTHIHTPDTFPYAELLARPPAALTPLCVCSVFPACLFLAAVCPIICISSHGVEGKRGLGKLAVAQAGAD